MQGQGNADVAPPIHLDRLKVPPMRLELGAPADKDSDAQGRETRVDPLFRPSFTIVANNAKSGIKCIL